VKNLPKKRWWAGALFFNTQWRILLLEPSYKDDWEIPWGIIEGNESPKETCVREVKEELWLDIEIWELLCLEYQREKDDSYMFIFDGWILSDNEVKNIVLQESEILSYHFLTVEEIESKLLSKMFVRIQKAVIAKKNNEIVYYETRYNR
jgi:8-oxo-dGTP pyrophosphatase MutT (NUDIX family)